VKISAVLAVIAISCLSHLFPTNQAFVSNTLKEIDACEGNLKLKLIRVWGGDDTDDENQFFRLPNDIKIGKDGLVYISDSGNHRIQVFDRTGNHVKTLGSRGNGPGDLFQPRALAIDNDNNILVADSSNRRIQALGTRGNYLFSFKLDKARKPSSIAVNSKNQILVGSHEYSFATGNLILLFDSRGNFIKEIGTIYQRSKSLLKTESIFLTVDTDDNIYIAYYAAPFYWKYSQNGEALNVVSFDMPGKRVQPSGNGFKIIGDMKANAASGITVDRQNRLYLVTSTRPVKKSEIFYLVGDRRYPRNIPSEKTDRFRLLVFNPDGKVIAARQLNVFCNRIYVHDNTLFIIDSFMGMKIYEYQINFSNPGGNPWDYH
jgi:sugar lactone lactonase YvrE